MIFAVIALVVCLYNVCDGINLSDCGGKSIRLNNYKFVPDNLRFGSKLNLSASVTVLNDVDGPINLRVYISRRVFRIYVKIPCIKEVGSCTYENGCDELEKLLIGKECPKEVLELGLSCTCPFKAGNYSVANREIYIPPLEGKIAKFFASGSYRANFILENPKTGYKHLCLDLELKVD